MPGVESDREAWRKEADVILCFPGGSYLARKTDKLDIVISTVKKQLGKGIEMNDGRYSASGSNSGNAYGGLTLYCGLHILLNLQKKCVKLLLSALHRKGNWGFEMLSNLLKVIWQASRGVDRDGVAPELLLSFTTIPRSVFLRRCHLSGHLNDDKVRSWGEKPRRKP